MNGVPTIFIYETLTNRAKFRRTDSVHVDVTAFMFVLIIDDCRLLMVVPAGRVVSRGVSTLHLPVDYLKLEVLLPRDGVHQSRVVGLVHFALIGYA